MLIKINAQSEHSEFKEHNGSDCVAYFTTERDAEINTIAEVGGLLIHGKEQ